jgi:ectoine hydroxylase-related dioxygenase (phytanoyl-CoA dioxygenase family)
VIVDIDPDLMVILGLMALVKTHQEWHCRPWPTYGYSYLVSLMAAHIWPNPEGAYYFQIEPNLRIHRPGEECTDWHTDAEKGHLEAEWNVWVPLTEMTDVTQRLWVEDTPAGRHPVMVELGQAYIFPGARWKHGTVKNTTDTERRSFDFRLIARSDYEDTGAKSVLYGVPLRLGDYWRAP